MKALSNALEGKAFKVRKDKDLNTLALKCFWLQHGNKFGKVKKSSKNGFLKDRTANLATN